MKRQLMKRYGGSPTESPSSPAKTAAYSVSNDKTIDSFGHHQQIPYVYDHVVQQHAAATMQYFQPQIVAPINSNDSNNLFSQAALSSYQQMQYQSHLLLQQQQQQWNQTPQPPLPPPPMSQPPPPPPPPQQQQSSNNGLPYFNPSFPPPQMATAPSSYSTPPRQNRNNSSTRSGGGRNGSAAARRNRSGSSSASSPRQPSTATKSGGAVNPFNNWSPQPFESDSSPNMAINKKPKRKPMSSHYTTKEWNPLDAIKALELEREITLMQHKPMLIVKFPDPELNKEIIKSFSTHIQNVHFQQPSTARYFSFPININILILKMRISHLKYRYCFVQLKSGSDLEKVKAELSEVSFGTGKLTVELKSGQNLTPEVLFNIFVDHCLFILNYGKSTFRFVRKTSIRTQFM